MTDFEIASPARVCSATGRTLAPGDAVISVLVEQDGKFVRSDFAANAWSEPPAEAIAWWKSHIPASTRPRKPTVNEDVLLDLFRHLAETAEPQKIAFRYVVALLLLRRKRLKVEDLAREPGRDVLVLRDTRSGERHECVDPRLDEAAIAAVQDDVFTALGWSQS